TDADLAELQVVWGDGDQGLAQRAVDRLGRQASDEVPDFVAHYALLTFGWARLQQGGVLASLTANNPPALRGARTAYKKGRAPHRIPVGGSSATRKSADDGDVRGLRTLGALLGLVLDLGV